MDIIKFPNVKINTLENIKIRATFTFRNIKFPNGQVMLTNRNIVVDERVKLGKRANIKADGFNFAISVSKKGFDVENKALVEANDSNPFIGRNIKQFGS